jgi:antitoxin component YwqK of YwqJK toxin-antitoxin module
VCELDQDSLLDGVCNYYYSTDSLIVATGRYVKGKKEGLFLEFDKKGRVYYSTYYLNDSVVLSFSYYLGGKLFKIVSSMNGKEKDFFMFRRFGNRINLQRRKHKNGVIHEIYFKRNGNISLEDRFPN